MLRFSLLGPLQVEHEQVVVDLGGGKQHLILTALLLARANVVSTDRLIELTWAGDPPTKPYVTMRSYISHLRRILEPERRPGDRARLLVTRSPGYALEVDAESVDIDRFRTLVDRAGTLAGEGCHEEALDVVDEGLGLWRSEDLADSPLVSFAGEVDRQIELRAEARGLRTDLLLDLGRHSQVIPDLRRLIEADPRTERPRGQLMIALHRSGRSADALEVYQAAVRDAIESTGLDVSPGLAELEARILANDPDLDWRPPAESRAVSAFAADPAMPAGPIGRVDQVDAARRILETPKGGLAAITGEPGIGKSHLVDHLTGLGWSLGLQPLRGQGHQGTGALALGPWRTLLLELSEGIDDDQLDQLVGSRAAELGDLVPEIPARLGVRPAGARDLLALHDTIARVLRRYASRQPVLLCLEDLHWADAASVRLLSFVLTTLRGEPVAALATWRDTETLPDDLGSALAELGSFADLVRLPLGGLGSAEVGDLWVTLGGREPERRSIEVLHRRTGGNPLFVAELVRSSPDAVPRTPTDTVQDAIMARLRSLPAPCRELLNIAALCPGGFTEELLAELSGFDDDTMIDCLELLLQHRILTEDPSWISQFTFSHSVIGESLAVQMSTARKARLHTRIADALQRKEAPIGQLAHHYLQGVAVGEPVVAARSALKAARSSARLHDHRGAVDLIERGLTALARSDDDLLRAELLVELAQQSKYQEHIPRTHSSALEAFRLAKRAGDIDLMVQAAFVYSGQGIEEDRQGLQWLGYWNPPGPAVDMLEDCLEQLAPGAKRVMVLLAYSAQLFGEYHDPEAAARALDEAVGEARALGNPTLLAASLHYQMTTLQRTLGFEERKALIDESLEVAERASVVNTEIAARRDLLVLGYDADAPDLIDEQLAKGLALARRLDDPMMAMMADSMPISIATYRGDLDGAGAALGEAMTRYERLGGASLDLFGIQFAALERERGNLSDVEAMLGWKLSGYPGPAYGVALALVMAEQGKLAEAENVLTEYGNESLTTGGEATLQFFTPAFYSGVLVALGDRDRAELLYPHLLPAAGRVVTLVSGLVLYGSGSLYLGRLATLLGRHDEAETHLDDAAEHHRRVGARAYSLRTDLARVELATARGQLDDAERLLSVATVTAEELAMTWLVDVTNRVLARHR